MMSKVGMVREAHKLHDLLVGATVISIAPAIGDEGPVVCILASKDDKEIEVSIFATDLGWWSESRTQRSRR